MARSLHTSDYDYFRSLLIAARERSGLTQAQVALKIRRPQSFVSKYEIGERRLDVVEFIEVCIALGVSPQSIVANLQKHLS